jgi:hypothetical protein
MKAAHDRRRVVADHGCGQVQWLCIARFTWNRAIKSGSFSTTLRSALLLSLIGSWRIAVRAFVCCD